MKRRYKPPHDETYSNNEMKDEEDIEYEVSNHEWVAFPRRTSMSYGFESERQTRVTDVR